MLRPSPNDSLLIVGLVGVLLPGCTMGGRSASSRGMALSGPTPVHGRLGHPLGKYLTIEGVRAEHGKVGVRTLEVDRIDGQEVSPPICIWIDNVDALPPGVRCVVNGYESGRMIGVPREVAEREHLPLQQAAWQFHTYFLATSVVAPEELKRVLHWPPGSP